MHRTLRSIGNAISKINIQCGAGRKTRGYRYLFFNDWLEKRESLNKPDWECLIILKFQNILKNNILKSIQHHHQYMYNVLNNLPV